MLPSSEVKQLFTEFVYSWLHAYTSLLKQQKHHKTPAQGVSSQSLLAAVCLGAVYFDLTGVSETTLQLVKHEHCTGGHWPWFEWA